MKLYKLFENIILREVGEPLTGNVSDEDVIDAINGKYFVNITYQDYPDAPPSKRYIQVYNFSDTVANNKAIRAYQAGGGSKTTPGRGGWKIFRLDRIRSWQPTKMKFYSPVDKFNPNGDRTMKSVHNIATFDDKYKTSKYQRKSVDVTPDVIANMSPEERLKYDASIRKSQDKFKVSRPKKINQPTTEPDTSAYIDKNPETDVIPVDIKQQSPNLTPNDDIKNSEIENNADIDYLNKKEKQRQERQEKLRAKIQKEKELKKRLQQKLATKNNKNLKTNKNDNTTTSRP